MVAARKQFVTNWPKTKVGQHRVVKQEMISILYWLWNCGLFLMKSYQNIRMVLGRLFYFRIEINDYWRTLIGKDKYCLLVLFSH